MKYNPGRPNDVIIQTMSAPRHRSRDGEESSNSYDAVIYSHLPVDVASAQSDRHARPLRNLPLRGVERLTIGQQAFTSWLASFLEGEKGMAVMRERMLGVMSPGLRDLLVSAPLSMRIWWNNTTPELEELPWELTVEAGRRDGPHRVAFFRGLPPETPIPALPLAGEPRLGMIGAQSTWPAWAHSVAQRMGNSVVKIDGPLQEALRQVVLRGVEFVHAFTDGIVSSALEGMLCDHAADRSRGRTSAGELSQILSGSRVVVLALSPAEYGSPDTIEMAGRAVLSSYRAFAYLGTSPRPLPTMLAPLGPVPPQMMADFWTAFYGELTASWHLTESLRRAQAGFPFSMPIALFSRHAGGKLFQAPGTVSGDAQPMEVRADLLRSEQFTKGLSQISDKYGSDLPASVKELLAKESSLQSRLRGELDGPIEEEGEL